MTQPSTFAFLATHVILPACAPAGETRVRMKPSSFALSLGVDPVTFTFDRATGNGP